MFIYFAADSQQDAFDERRDDDRGRRDRFGGGGGRSDRADTGTWQRGVGFDDDRYGLSQASSIEFEGY